MEAQKELWLLGADGFASMHEAYTWRRVPYTYMP
jgi:hypothetical protein